MNLRGIVKITNGNFLTSPITFRANPGKNNQLRTKKLLICVYIFLRFIARFICGVLLSFKSGDLAIFNFIVNFNAFLLYPGTISKFKIKINLFF